jgi:hypothetical protein
MVESVYTPSYSKHDDKTPLGETKAPRLTLVVSNPPAIEKSSRPFLLSRPTEGFSAELKAVPVKDEPFTLYEMTIKDPSHYLECTLKIEVQEDLDKDKEGKVICRFSPLNDNPLNDLVMKDETLFSLILIQFQMKVMEQLLLFCADRYASRLTISMNDEEAEKFGIYEDFLTHKKQTRTISGKQTEMVMSADQETFDAWVNFMDKTKRDFRQTLWKDQRENPVIQFYLKSDPQLAFF